MIGHPIDSVQWIDRARLIANDYNPNSQLTEAQELLLESIRTDGWTQPIVVRPPNQDGIYVIVDGEHRWKCSEHLDGDTVPVVILEKDDAGCMAATVRHNRARGSHGVDHMVHIMGRLTDEGVSDSDMETMLGMSPEERERLVTSETAFLAMMAGKDGSMST